MGKKTLLFIIIIFIFLTSCNSSTIKPVSINKEEFDLATANEMITELEEPIINFTMGDTISRLGLEELSNQFVIFSKQGQNMSYTFINGNDLEDKNKEELRIDKSNFIPTIFHEEINIVGSYVETVLYDEKHSELNSKTLYIEEKYSGNDEKLKDFWRTYRFLLQDNSQWVYAGFSGDANYIGDNFSRNYLPLK